MATRHIALAILIAAGCTSPGASTSSAPETPPPTIHLQVAADPTYCPLAALPPGPLTFNVDPAAAGVDQVKVLDASGEPHSVFWAEGFTGGALDNPVIKDPDGEIVARDGEVLESEIGGTRLHGYPVCAGSNAIYVLLLGRE